MKAMILAAGKGERMRPLTTITPKPLLKVGGKSLIEWHLINLAKAGFKTVVINNAWLGQKIVEQISDTYLDMKIIHSSEPECLETAGGIAFALEYLDNFKDTPFVVINGDTFIPNLPCIDFIEKSANFTNEQKAFLYLVENPQHNPLGDFNLVDNKLFLKQEQEQDINNIDIKIQSLTFSGMALYRPSMFKHIIKGEHAQLSPVLNKHIVLGEILGVKFNDIWHDIGTIQRLECINNMLLSGELKI